MANRSIATAVALSALALAAQMPVIAADYPVLRGSQIDDMPPAPILGRSFSWEGFYVGGFAGVSRSAAKPSADKFQSTLGAYNVVLGRYQNSRVVDTALFSPGSSSDSGANFGGFAGYNVAFGDAIIGFEADYNRMNHRFQSFGDLVTVRTPSGDRPGDLVVAQQLNDYATARIRFGYAMGQIMPYATLGLAVGRGSTTVGLAPAGPLPHDFQALAVRDKNTYIYGASAGLGVDAVVAENLLLRAEYMFTRFGSLNGTVIDINTARVGAGLKF